MIDGALLSPPGLVAKTVVLGATGGIRDGSRHSPRTVCQAGRVGRGAPIIR